MNTLTLLLAAACAAAIVPAHAQTSPPAPHAAPAAGMVVVRDAKTGQLRAPTAAEFKALRGQQPGPTQLAPPVAEVRADGSRRLRLGERYQVYSVYTRETDGSSALHCVRGAEAASNALQPAQPAKESGHETD